MNDFTLRSASGASTTDSSRPSTAPASVPFNVMAPVVHLPAPMAPSMPAPAAVPADPVPKPLELKQDGCLCTTEVSHNGYDYVRCICKDITRTFDIVWRRSDAILQVALDPTRKFHINKDMMTQKSLYNTWDELAAKLVDYVVDEEYVVDIEESCLLEIIRYAHLPNHQVFVEKKNLHMLWDAAKHLKYVGIHEQIRKLVIERNWLDVANYLKFKDAKDKMLNELNASELIRILKDREYVAPNEPAFSLNDVWIILEAARDAEEVEELMAAGQDDPNEQPDPVQGPQQDQMPQPPPFPQHQQGYQGPPAPAPLQNQMPLPVPLFQQRYQGPPAPVPLLNILYGPPPQQALHMYIPPAVNPTPPIGNLPSRNPYPFPLGPPPQAQPQPQMNGYLNQFPTGFNQNRFNPYRR